MTFYERLNLLLRPLSDDQADQLRTTFAAVGRPAGDASRLIRQWQRVAESAHQLALKRNAQRSRGAILTSPSVKARRDRQLSRVIRGATRAIEGLDDITELLPKHQYFADCFAYNEKIKAWAPGVRAELLGLRARVSVMRACVKQWPRQHYPSAEQRWAVEGALVDVLAAYFRYRGWQVGRSSTGLFAETLYAVLPETRHSINAAKLRRAASSSLSYVTLEADAPHVEFVDLG